MRIEGLGGMDVGGCGWGGGKCRMSNLRNASVAYLCHLSPCPLAILRNAPKKVVAIISILCCVVESKLSHVHWH